MLQKIILIVEKQSHTDCYAIKKCEVHKKGKRKMKEKHKVKYM